MQSAAEVLQSPKVLVLLAACNGRKWLPEQLKTILCQQGVRVEVWIGLDKSSDDTKTWVVNQAAQDERVKMLSAGEGFGSAARNFYRLLRDMDLQGVDAIALADQDDIWLPDRLSRAWQSLKSGYQAYSSDVLAFWDNGKQRLIVKSQPQKKWDFLFESAGPGCTFVLSASLAGELQSWLREHWEKVQQLHHHDWLIYAFARVRSYRWLIDSYVGVHYRQHENNELGARVGLQGLWRRLKRIGGGRGFGQVRKLVQLLELEREGFVQSWYQGQRLGFLRLALSASDCRRYWLDQWLMALFCLKTAISGDSAVDSQTQKSHLPAEEKRQ
jgi:rhamnosyltransferase